MDFEIEEKTFNDFVISAIVEKFNGVNTVFNGTMGKDGFID